MSAKLLFTFKHFKFALLPLLTHSAVHCSVPLYLEVYPPSCSHCTPVSGSQLAPRQASILCVTSPAQIWCTSILERNTCLTSVWTYYTLYIWYLWCCWSCYLLLQCWCVYKHGLGYIILYWVYVWSLPLCNQPHPNLMYILSGAVHICYCCHVYELVGLRSTRWIWHVPFRCKVSLAPPQSNIPPYPSTPLPPLCYVITFTLSMLCCA